MVMLANELRAANSPSFIAEELYRVAKEAGKECIIESIRTVGEITSLRKQENFYLFAVDADQKLRYTRIVERASETDKINFETFVDNELREMTNKCSRYSFDFLKWKRKGELSKHFEVYEQSKCPNGHKLTVKNTGKSHRRSYFCTNCQVEY